MVKDLALSLLWHEFHPWLEELSHAKGVAKKKMINFNITLQLVQIPSCLKHASLV